MQWCAAPRAMHNQLSSRRIAGEPRYQDRRSGRPARAPHRQGIPDAELLSLRKGTTLTKEMFLNISNGGMDEPELKIIDVFICKLRQEIGTAAEGKNFIETVWGRGTCSAKARRPWRPGRLPRNRLNAAFETLLDSA